MKATDGELEKLLEQVQGKLGGADFKPSIAEMVRLLELGRELDSEKPKALTVRWIERCEPTTSSGE